MISDLHKPQFKFLLVSLAVVAVLLFFIFRPFLFSLLLAVILAVVFQPLYQRILKATRQHEGLAAIVTTLLVVVFILTPLTFLGVQILREAQQLYLFLTENSSKDMIFNVFKNLINEAQLMFPGAQDFSFNFNTDQYLKNGATWLLQNLGAIFSNLAQLLVNSFIFLIAFYYLLKDGQKLRKTVVDLSPLGNAEDETILKKLESAVNSVVRGNLVIAIIQGTSTAIGLTLFGVPNAVLWGTVAAVTALIPGVGTSLVIIPSIAFLFLSDKIVPMFGLIIWGIVAVGLIDNFLGPRLVGRGMKLHPLLVILSVLGGVAFLGPVGFLLGPLAVSLFFTFLDIYVYLLGKESDV
jgi:predicted PurR-regulated permease PerM